jgi:hypothetical protein
MHCVARLQWRSQSKHWALSKHAVLRNAGNKTVKRYKCGTVKTRSDAKQEKLFLCRERNIRKSTLYLLYPAKHGRVDSCCEFCSSSFGVKKAIDFSL